MTDGEAVVKKGNRRIATLGPGQYFGELSMLDGGERSASVVAARDMTVVIIGQREFSALIAELPSIARKLLAAMAIRLRKSDAKASN